MNELALAIEEAGLNVELVRPDTGASDGFAPQNLTLRHKNYGSEHYFQVTTNTAGLISSQSDVPDWIQTGVDVKGEIAGEESTGRGQILTGGPVLVSLKEYESVIPVNRLQRVKLLVP